MYLQLHDPAFLAVASGGTPALDLFFSATKALDSRITFTRGSTGTFINSSGLVETASAGVARFTHDPSTLASLGLLIEESRTNLLQRSEELNTSPWSAVNATVSANAAVAPSGATTADKIVEDTSTNVHYIFQSATVVSGTTYSLSFYAKESGRNWFCLGIIGLGVTGDVFFDLTNGVVGNVKAGVTASIQAVGNGWYRCVVVGAATSTSFQVYPQPRTSNGGSSYTGNGTSGVLVWGCQLEAGAFITSYIPTTSATVTRAADVATMTGTNFSSWYNQTEGTLVTDFTSTGTALNKNFQVAALDGGSNNSGLAIVNAGNTAAQVYIPPFSIQASLTTPLASSLKAALAYKLNDFAASFNGGTVLTDTSGTLPTPAVLYLGNGPVSSEQTAGTIARIRYFRRRLPNANLQTLTT